MGIKIEIYDTKIYVYDELNSIAYYRHQSIKYRNFKKFKLQMEAYKDLHRNLSYADIFSLADENELKAVYAKKI